MRRSTIRPGLYSRQGERKYLTADERRRFLAAADRAAPDVRAFCRVLAFTGCRISEALGLTARDIDATGGLIAIRCLKKRGMAVIREVPVPATLLAELALWHQCADRTLASAACRLWSWGRTTAWRLVKDIMAAAGIIAGAGTPKGLRHGFGVHAVQSGVPLNMVQKWLGHEDIATTAIYANAMGPEERAIAQRMWQEPVADAQMVRFLAVRSGRYPAAR